jgi:UDP-N-acetylglucosamine 2-epimerase
MVKSIHLIAAARPNFMKIAPLYHEFKKTDWAEPVIVHTGQHYDVNCRLAITDSVGIQEETTYLGIPCLTLRPNTERPITVTQGSNRLCTPEGIENQAISAMVNKRKIHPPMLWDGKTAGRVVESAKRFILSGQGIK